MPSSEGSPRPGFALRRDSAELLGATGEDGREALPVKLGPEDLVDLRTERSLGGVDEVLAEFDRDLVGLRPVKDKISEIAALLGIDRLRSRYGLSSDPPSLHMSFTGSPGTGKTTVAKMMAEILRNLGYLRQGHLVCVTRDDLVGQFIGHTAPKTKEVLQRAMGGVLFIDEAYYLYRGENERDYGQESIEILLQVMENQRDDLVVIFAGYRDRMESFFRSNPGFSSRVAHHIDFPDYSISELNHIGRLIVQREGYRFSNEGAEAFSKYLTLRVNQPNFSNARSVRNAIERARLRQAKRLWGSGAETLSMEDLMTLTDEDIYGSRVFSQGEQA